jgi:alpha-glucosidase
MWWRRGVVYEIYPRSFQDTDGDGVGDLRGVADRLPYLARLGVDAIWLTPFFASPMRDFGYDITDHCAVDSSFGTMEDFDALVAAAHAQGLKVLLDFVPNHTSDLHPWFDESRASRESPKRDWYIWRDGREPTNWISVFGGRAWEWDVATGQSYYHAYLPEQPDLNWRNPEVREAMLGILRFWKARGVDGFRVDAMRQVLKDPQWRDNPPAEGWEGPADVYAALVPRFTTDLDETQEVVAAIRAEIGDDHLFMAEVTVPIERLVRYYGADGDGAHLPFNFHLIGVEWTAEAIAALVERYEAALPEGAWPNWVLGNHDQPRVASRVGAGQARAAAMLLLTLRGTPTLYQGDELGMEDVEVPPERVVDPDGRDPERSPMPWTGAPGRGFCPDGVEPWLPFGDPAVNVEAQEADPRSMLALHRRLLALRRSSGDLAEGAYETLVAGPAVLAYRRGSGTVVALNLGDEPASAAVRGEIVLTTGLDGREGERVEGSLTLCGGEGAVLVEGAETAAG